MDAFESATTSVSAGALSDSVRGCFVDRTTGSVAAVTAEAGGVTSGDATDAVSATRPVSTGGTGTGRVGKSRGVSRMTAATSTSASTVRRSMFTVQPRLGYRIVTADMERMAPSDPANRENQSAPRPVLLQRLNGVHGAAGRVPAHRRKQRPEEKLVRANEGNQDGPHAIPGFIRTARPIMPATSLRSAAKES